MKVAISNCLNHDGHSKDRIALDNAVLAYYANLEIDGIEFLLHAVGSSKKDASACKKHGWEYTEAPNGNLGAKRNAGMKVAIGSGADVVFRIGSDDLVSPALLQEVCRRASYDVDDYWELRGFYLYNTITGEMYLSKVHQFALAFRPGIVKGDLYNDGNIHIDAGLDIRLRGWARRWHMITTPINTPMIACKSSDALHAFDRTMELEPLLFERAPAGAVFNGFPGFKLAKPKTKNDAST